MKHSARPRRFVHGSLIALAILAFAGNSMSVSAGIKCWTNKDGVRECGDRLPPEYAQKGHEQISDSGVKVKVFEAAKTPEEIAEARRLAADEAERARIARIRAAEQLADDQVLLSEDLAVFHYIKSASSTDQRIHRHFHIRRLSAYCHEVVTIMPDA